MSLKFICQICRRTYRLREESSERELLCYHCGAVLNPINASETVIKEASKGVNPPESSGFETLLHNFSQNQHIPTDELKLIEEMRSQGVVDTSWLKRNYQSENRETKETEFETVEEFKPLIFGGYQALYAIGEGGTGIVYKGWKIGSDQLVAIKRLHPDKIKDTISRERFFREIGCLKELNHPNILPLLDGGEKNGEFFIITPFIGGGSLSDRIKALPVSHRKEEAWPLFAIIIQIGNALHYAHERGLVHRDVKPVNILLATQDHPYLADFGLAKHIDVTSPKLTHGAVGTPSYMAPELWQQQVSPQIDIYALGVILYEIITGIYPFVGETPTQLLAQQLHSLPKLPVLPSSSFPSDLNGLILKALAVNPLDRHKTAREFTHDLKQILSK